MSGRCGTLMISPLQILYSRQLSVCDSMFKNLGHSCHSKEPLGLAVSENLCMLFAWVETTMMTPKPEYLETLATYLRVRW